jgi:hypothetical protein
MRKRREIVTQYSDVIVWLAHVGSKDLIKLSEIKDEAIEETANHFHISRGEVDALVRGTQIQYSDSETAIVVFFYEYLRKTQDSHQ